LAGTAEQKAKLMFDMYDTDRKGKLSKAQFKMMLRYVFLEIIKLRLTNI